jgi:hypothetical protein
MRLEEVEVANKRKDVLLAFELALALQAVVVALAFGQAFVVSATHRVSFELDSVGPKIGLRSTSLSSPDLCVDSFVPYPQIGLPLQESQ